MFANFVYFCTTRRKKPSFDGKVVETLARNTTGGPGARRVKLYIVCICKNVFDIIKNNAIKWVFLNKTYLSNSQFVFSQCISHLLLRNAPSVYLS